MPKMRVLIAARGDRRSALARALGVHRARPSVEVGAADTREVLFRTLSSGTWHVLVISPSFDGAAAAEVIAAASEQLRSIPALVLNDAAADIQDIARRILKLQAGSQSTPESRSSALTPNELPACQSLDELLALDGRRPRTGLLSCVLIRSAAAHDVEPIVARRLAGGVACRWRGDDVLVLRRAASPGEALVWAQTLSDQADASSVGVTWFRAADLQESCINQAEHAMVLAESRGGGLATWVGLAALRLGERIASTIDQPEPRRERLLKDLTLGPEQRQQLTRHSEEVSDAAVKLAQLLRVGPEACERVRLAGLFHDIGKIAVPDDLLAKPGPLSPEERRVLDRHSIEGAWLCDALGIDPEVGRIVRHHHTRFDALEIAPDAARVVAVADAMVTMTSARPYSAARTFEYALAELRRCRGTVFDPRVVVAAHILGASSMKAAA